MEVGVVVQIDQYCQKRESGEGQRVTLNLAEMSLISLAILVSFCFCDKHQREAIYGRKCAG